MKIIIKVIHAKSGFEKPVFENSLWHTYQSCKIAVASILFMMAEEGEKKVLELMEDACYCSYDVMAIDL